MIPPPFRYLGPSSVDEALTMLATTEGAAVLAGGQSLVNALKLDLVQPAALVDVHRLPELRGIEVDGEVLRIGAAVTYAELAASPVVREHVPALASVAAGLVDRQVRNRGTIGGNCCLNDPTNNLPPLLSALDATFTVLRDGAAPRELAADDFFLGTLFTEAHGPNLLSSVVVPVQRPTTVVAYRHQQVGADSWALARAVVRVDRDDSGISESRVYLGAVPDSPRRLPRVEAALTGGAPGPELVRACLEAFDAEDVPTVGDAHGSAGYRLAMARVQLKRAIEEITTTFASAEEAVA